MKAARLFGKNDIRIMEIETPVPKAGQVLCKVKRCGICGTDYSIFNGAFKSMISYPMTLGHEWSGVVETAGPGTAFAPGDRVAGDTCVSCGVCYDCLVGNYVRCKKRRSVGTIFTWDGAYSEYVLFPARHLFRLPDHVDFENGAMLEPAATAMLGRGTGGSKAWRLCRCTWHGPDRYRSGKDRQACGSVKGDYYGQKRV